jgi:hypothetical protein
VVKTALKLVAHKGHEMSEVASGSIKTRHILVTTPYSGQAALLWTRFKEVTRMSRRTRHVSAVSRRSKVMKS